MRYFGAFHKVGSLFPEKLIATLCIITVLHCFLKLSAPTTQPPTYQYYYLPYLKPSTAKDCQETTLKNIMKMTTTSIMEPTQSL